MESNPKETSDLTHSEGAAFKYSPESEHRKSFLSLRWLVAILAAYLTLFSHLSGERFTLVFTFALAFSATNIAIALIPAKYFRLPQLKRAIAVTDVIFVCATFYILRVPNTYFYIAFGAIFCLAVIWRELKLVLFSIFVVSMLFGVFSYFRIARLEATISIEHFLTLALFFVVSIFYIFLTEQLDRDSLLSAAVLEQKRNAEITVEVTRALSSSLKTQDVLLAIVTRLQEVLHAEDCSIIGIDPQTAHAQVMVRSLDPTIRNVDIDLADFPALKEAYTARKMLFRPAGKHSIIVMPMIVQDTVLGVIEVLGYDSPLGLSESNFRFFEVMAGTAANALRNAQLFEAVEHRARTDFLTGLPNHRYFQSTLSLEIGRAQRHNHSLSLLMIDLDFLKVVNDRFGHPSGDLVIRAVADTIRSSCREIDFAARYGGEEFTVILPETPLAGAIQVADRVRERVAQTELPVIGSITASIGVSNYPINALTKEDIIRVADQALYVAKNGGRDRVAYFNYQLITR